MPYAALSDLPTDVKALPEEGQRLWLRVANSAIAAGSDDADASKIAWGGVANAGWSKASGQWARVEKRLVAKRRKADGEFDIALPVASFKRSPGASAAEHLDVFGWASVALDDHGNVVIDHGEEDIPVGELESAAYEFVAKRMPDVSDVNHETHPFGELIEAVMVTPEKRVAMGMDGTGRAGFWVGVRIRDADAIKRVKSGELKELSLEFRALKYFKGTSAKRGTMRDIHIKRIALVDAGEGKGVTIELFKQRKESSMSSKLWVKVKKALGVADTDLSGKLDAVLAKLSEDERKTVELALEAVGGKATDEPADAEAVAKAKAEKDAADAKAVAAEKAKRASDPAAGESEEVVRLKSRIVEMEKRQRRAEFVELAKRYSHCADGKTDEQRADLLAEAEAALPKASYDAILKSFDSMNAAGREFVKVSGSPRPGQLGPKTDEGELERIAQDLQAKDPSMNYAKAYVAAMDSPQGVEIMKRRFTSQSASA